MLSRPSPLALLLSLALTAGLATAEETLPTPYTAEEIRDSFREGLQIVTRTWTPDGETLSRMTVDAWGEEKVTIGDQPVDTDGGPSGEETRAEATWTDLRDHAAFNPKHARRERHTAFTALGRFEGWLYTVDEEDAGLSLFFFADRYPGPPLLYQSFAGGELVFRAEQISRTMAEPSELAALPEPALAELPAEARRRLEHAIGTWQVRAEQIDAEGNVVGTREWQNRAEWLLPGRMVLLTHRTAHLGSVSKALVFYSVEEQTWYLIDVNQNGERWVLTGDLEREVITSQPRELPDGREILVRFTHEKVEADSFEALQEVSFDRGETWTVSGRQYLTRIR